MAPGRMTARTTVAVTLSAASVLSWAGPVNAAPVNTTEEACAAAKTRVSARDDFPISSVAFCDAIAAESNPRGYIVLALHGRRFDCGPDNICGSTNMGWFAVQKATGQVFEWSVAKWKLGRQVVSRS